MNRFDPIHKLGLARIRLDRSAEPTRPPQDLTACIHRGDEVEEILCPTCAGSVRIKIFECLLPSISRCQLGHKIAAIHSCDGCPKKLSGDPP